MFKARCRRAPTDPCSHARARGGLGPDSEPEVCCCYEGLGLPHCTAWWVQWRGSLAELPQPASSLTRNSRIVEMSSTQGNQRLRNATTARAYLSNKFAGQWDLAQHATCHTRPSLGNGLLAYWHHLDPHGARKLCFRPRAAVSCQRWSSHTE